MTAKSRKFGSDMIVALVFLVMCVFLAVKVAQIKTVESRIMPFFALGVISISSFLLIVKTLVAERPALVRLIHSKREFFVWALFAIMVFMMKAIGFYPSMFLFTVASQLYLKEKKGKRILLSSAIYAIAFTLIIYIVFSVLFRMQLPLGSLFS